MPLNWGLYAYVERKEMPAACADTAEESKQPFFFLSSVKLGPFWALRYDSSPLEISPLLLVNFSVLCIRLISISVESGYLEDGI